MTTFAQLSQLLLDDLELRKDDILGSPCEEDYIKPFIEARVPSNHGELIEILASLHGLAYVSDLSAIPAYPSVWDILRQSIYDNLTNTSTVWLFKQRNSEDNS